MLTPESFKGDYSRDSTNFKTHGLQSFDIQIDSRSLVGYPITREGDISVPFYYKFLKECNFYGNNYSSGPMSYESFTKFNFMIVENLRRRNITSGQLTVSLKFKRILQQKLYLIIMPVYKKSLTFDEFFTPEVNENQSNSQTTSMED